MARRSTKSKKENRLPVWIIDDNEQFCIVLSEALNRSKTVRCLMYFLSGKNALQHFEHNSELPSVILLDIKMPLVSGIDLIRPLQEISPATKIIMLTSYGEDEFVKAAFQQGAHGYLLKTSTSEDIIRAIEKVCQNELPIDPKLTRHILETFAGNAKHQDDYHLTERERTIINLFAEGMDVEQVAKQLVLSVHTVHTHRKNIYQKLHVHSRSSLVSKALKENLTD